MVKTQRERQSKNCLSSWVRAKDAKTHYSQGLREVMIQRKKEKKLVNQLEADVPPPHVPRPKKERKKSVCVWGGGGGG